MRISVIARPDLLERGNLGIEIVSSAFAGAGLLMFLVMAF